MQEIPDYLCKKKPYSALLLGKFKVHIRHIATGFLPTESGCKPLNSLVFLEAEV